MQEKTLTLNLIKISKNYYKFGANNKDVIAIVYIAKTEFEGIPKKVEIKIKESE